MLTDFIAFDFEMPSQKEPAISAVGITVVKNLKIIDRIYSLINPEAPFSPYVIELIGITPEMVKDKPTLPEYWEQISKYFSADNVLVAHAAYGDLLTLSLALDRYGLSIENDIKYLCTCDMTLAESPELEHHTLDFICESLEIELTHHNAQSDSDGCAQVLMKYIEKGVDVEKHIKALSGKQIVSQHRRKAFAKTVKGITFKNKKQKPPKNPSELELILLKEIKQGPQTANKKEISKSIIRNDCRYYGINEEFIKRFAKNMDFEDSAELLVSSHLHAYELYFLYAACFNLYGFDAKELLKILYSLPSYYIAEAFDITVVCDAFFNDYKLDEFELAEELTKRNVYGMTSMGIHIICKTEMWKSNPECVLDCLEHISKNKFSSDTVLTKKYAEILSRLIASGKYDERILTIGLSATSIRLAISEAITHKPTSEDRIKRIYKKYI